MFALLLIILGVTVLLIGVMRTSFTEDGFNCSICEWILAYPVMLVGGREGCVVAWINKRMHENIRRRALKKAAKSK